MAPYDPRAPERPEPAPSWVQVTELDPELERELSAHGCQVSHLPPSVSERGILLPKDATRIALHREWYGGIFRVALPDGFTFWLYVDRGKQPDRVETQLSTLPQKAHMLDVTNSKTKPTAHFACRACLKEWEQVAPPDDCYGVVTYVSLDSRGLNQLTLEELQALRREPADLSKYVAVVVAEGHVEPLYDINAAKPIEEKAPERRPFGAGEG